MAQAMRCNMRSACAGQRQVHVKCPQAAVPRGRSSVRCSAEVPRREVLLAGVATVALGPFLPSVPAAQAEARLLAVDKLSTFQKNDQRTEIIRRVTGHLKEALTGADAPAVIKLAFNDAATYDVATGTGGFDASIVLPEELNRPENVSLKPLVERLAEVKKVVDAENAAQLQDPISWADLIYLAARTSTRQAWAEIKFARAATASGAALIADNFAADWTVQLGRIDATEAAPAGRLPATDASVEDIKQFMAGLGAKPSSSFLPTKPPFWERPAFVVWTASTADPAAEEARFAASDSAFADLKRKYDFSRATVTRTDYEVDFVTYFNKLTSLGCKFKKDAYLHPEVLPNIRL